jgi:hypothetical protein
MSRQFDTTHHIARGLAATRLVHFGAARPGGRSPRHGYSLAVAARAGDDLHDGGANMNKFIVHTQNAAKPRTLVLFEYLVFTGVLGFVAYIALGT